MMTKIILNVNLIRKYRLIISLGIMAFMLTGCSQVHSPLFPMLGAYFPYWMLCVLIGLVGTLLVRVLLIYLDIDDKLPLPLVFYFCVLLSITLTVSLLYFSY